MSFDFTFLITSILKIVGVLAYLYGLLWVLGHKQLWVKIVGVIAAFGIIQLGITPIGGFQLFNDFDSGLLFQACTMSMVAMGLNLIYGFNGQFSLGQWGFYGIGAYAGADITYRWVNGDARGLLVAGIGVILGGVMIWAVNKLVNRYKGMPVLSQFTLYLIGAVAAGAVAVFIGNALNPLIAPLIRTEAGPGPLSGYIPMQIVFFLAVLIACVFAALVSFLFGLPVLTLGSDYFGIATLGFSIVVYTLMVNSDTILPFPEMKGARGMVGIPRLTTWFWSFLFLVLCIIILRNILHSSTGRAIVSVRENEIAAKAMGIDTVKYKTLSFVIGGIYAGLAGGIYAHLYAFLHPSLFHFIKSFDPMIIVVFGGLGSITGTVVAAFAWALSLEGLRIILPSGAEAWRYIIYPVALLLIMLLRPQGLLGGVEWGFLKPITWPRRKIETGAPTVETVGQEAV